MRRLSLLIVGTFGGGGIHQYADEQYRQLKDQHDVAQFDMHTPDSGSGLAWTVAALCRTLWAAVRFPFRTRPDVVHVHTSHRFSFYRAAFYVLVAAHLWRTPVVLHVHGSSFDEFIQDPRWPVAKIQNLVFGSVDHVVVLSEYWKSAVQSSFDLDDVTAVPNAVEPAEYEPEFDHDRPHVVFVSNLIERKGVNELTSAIERLKPSEAREFRVTIAGKGPLSPQVERIAERYDDVRYLGYISESKKRDLLDNGSIFVLPAYAEGLPIAMLEGMAGGNAVVATDVGSIPEVIGDENGILVSPGDVDELSDALEKLIDSPDAVKAMGTQNRRDVCDRYSWEVAIAELNSIYRAVLGAEPEPKTGKGAEREGIGGGVAGLGSRLLDYIR